MKICWKCKLEKPLENFARNKSKSSGRSAECKSCVKAYNIVHCATNAEYYKGVRKAKRRHNLAWYLFLECRTRARRAQLTFNLEPSDIVIPELCPVFGFPLGTGSRDASASVDRKDCTLGYVKGNVRVISYLANRMKSNATDTQLMQFAAWILEDFGGSERCMDTTEGEGADSNEHAREAPAKSRTWQN
jgi:hypothetical protein